MPGSTSIRTRGTNVVDVGARPHSKFLPTACECACESWLEAIHAPVMSQDRPQFCAQRHSQSLRPHRSVRESSASADFPESSVEKKIMISPSVAPIPNAKRQPNQIGNRFE